MARYNADARDRISRAVKRTEQSVTPQHRERWRRQAPASGGGGGLAIFLVDTDLPARSGDELGMAELTRYKIEDGNLVSAETTEEVYNATAATITAISPADDPPEGEDPPPNCNPSIGDGKLYIVAAKIAGVRLALHPLYPLVPTTVGTGLTLTVDALEMSRVSILAMASECETQSIEVTECP